MRDQIRGPAGLVMHSCADGFVPGFDNEFVVYLKYARRSASQIQSEIYLALDRKYVDRSALKHIHEEVTETKKIINALIAYRGKGKPGRSLPNFSTKRLFDDLTMDYYAELP